MTVLERTIRHQFTDAGVRGWLHAKRLTDRTSREVAIDADDPVVMASIYKLPLLISFCRLVDDSELDPLEPVEVIPDQRTPGPTGLSVFRDPVTVSWRDLACSMVTVSDNASADVILARVGLEYLERTLQTMGLNRTKVIGGTADVQRSLMDQTNTETTADALAVLGSNDDALSVAAYDPALASSTTPRDMTRLLDLIWADEAASPDQCQSARELLLAQIWPHRLRAGFPYDGVQVSGKTGTLGAVRNEVGVVHFIGEHPVAVAVFTHAARADSALPRADQIIGETAKLAVTELRSGRL